MRCVHHSGDALSCGNSAGWAFRDVELCDECMSAVLRRSPATLAGDDFVKLSPVEAAAPSTETMPHPAAPREGGTGDATASTGDSVLVAELYAQITRLQERGTSCSRRTDISKQSERSLPRRFSASD